MQKRLVKSCIILIYPHKKCKSKMQFLHLPHEQAGIRRLSGKVYNLDRAKNHNILFTEKRNSLEKIRNPLEP